MTVFRTDSVERVRTSCSGRSATVEREEAPAARAYGSSAVKRVIDVALGLVALVLLSPVFVLVAIAVRFSSKGPVLFRQERVGRGQRPFTMFKFRTMYVGLDDAEHRAYVRAMLTPGEDFEAAQSGLHKLDDDRITAVGRVLRRMSLDELPQLLNVIAGSMSLVGPRPVLPWEVELLDQADHIRFEVKPGMTGLWQVSGRSRLPMSEAFQLDREYVAQQSFQLDLKILLKTLPAVLFAGDAA
jgi:lipopolysaccharide/colanic/teichoic acid biosynthesis glycosyltransferase